jgi:MYXO-CTERM domain-containing protein
MGRAFNLIGSLMRAFPFGAAMALRVGLGALGLSACEGGPGGIETVRTASTIDQEESTMAADPGRTGFYPDQPALDPATVGSPFFGQLFEATVDGQIYAQPLYANGVLLVATETNHVYGLDPAMGGTLWTRQLGAPFLASDVNCGDLQPSVGVTGTPAIDADTGTAYLLSKTYVDGTSLTAAWYAHAIEIATGVERDGFPVAIVGSASNEPTQVFNPKLQMQRPGLLLMNGVVYAAFGAHCDVRPYSGWVVGISTRGFVQTLWTAEAGPGNPSGAGIWQSGGGLVSDGDGQILFATGNDWSSFPAPVSGKQPPATLGESIVRLSVQPDGTLAATDFFSPSERDALNQGDADLGSGAPVALPAGFGAGAHQNLLVQAGKSGFLYLLDRDDLGGYRQGPDGADRILQKLGSFGGVWSKPSVWPGDGGYVYVPVVNGCSVDEQAGCLRAFKVGASADGIPMLASVATTSSTFSYGASAGVVTSHGTTSGSALLWTVWSAGGDGTGGQLRAYDAVPQEGTLALRYLAGIGTSAKFTAPAVGDGRIYVGTRDGHVAGFGVTGAASLRAQGAVFPPTLVGDDSLSSVQVTTLGAVSIVGLGISGDFALTAAAPEVPFPVAGGASFSIPVVFRPTSEGPIVGELRITTDSGSFMFPLTGVGQSRVPDLAMSPSIVTFAPIVIGNTSTQTVTITNVSDASMTLTASTPPAAPFTVSGIPRAGTIVQAGDSFVATITYAPTTIGSSSAYFGVLAGSVVAAVAVEGSALVGGKLRITPDVLDAGSMIVGRASTAIFQLMNEGDAPLRIEQSKPPISSVFQAEAPFDEGTVLAPGASFEQLVNVAPAVAGVATDVWQLDADDGQGLRVLSMTVTGVTPPAPVAPTTTTGMAGASAPMLMSEPRASGTSRADAATVVGGCSVADVSSPVVGPVVAALAALLLGLRRRRRDGTGS